MSAQGIDHSASCWCHYLPNLVAVRPDRVDESIAASGGRALENGEACRLLDGLDHTIVSEILERVGVIRVDEPDPHEIVASLNTNEIEASPIHGVGFLGHGGFQGGDWAVAPGRSFREVTAAERGIVAVVDSGIVPESELPRWMDGPNVACSRPLDTEQLSFRHPISHGTFVTSLMRRVVPSHHVSLAAARPDPGHLRTNDPDHRSAPPATDELTVLGAVLRLLRRHRDVKEPLAALNLSLGVHACPNDGPQRFLALRTACAAWIDAFGVESPIFAAAGNSLCGEPLYPAGFSQDPKLGKTVRGVAAAREGRKSGEIKVWDHGMEVPAPHRQWVTDAAPGCDVLGLTGQSPDHLAWWSGSSHATAVATALHVTGSRPEHDSGIGWWPDRPVTFASVPGLI